MKRKGVLSNWNVKRAIAIPFLRERCIIVLLCVLKNCFWSKQPPIVSHPPPLNQDNVIANTYKNLAELCCGCRALTDARWRCVPCLNKPHVHLVDPFPTPKSLAQSKAHLVVRRWSAGSEFSPCRLTVHWLIFMRRPILPMEVLGAWYAVRYVRKPLFGTGSFTCSSVLWRGFVGSWGWTDEVPDFEIRYVTNLE